MGQNRWHGADRIQFLEQCVVGDIAGLNSGSGCLSLVTNENGGIIDDTVITKYEDYVYMVSVYNDYVYLSSIFSCTHLSYIHVIITQRLSMEQPNLVTWNTSKNKWLTLMVM